MKKWYVLCLIAVLLFVISGCSASMDETGSSNYTESVHPTEEKVEETVPLLDSSEYWEIVQDEIIAMLNNHNLYVSHIDSGYPTVQFFVEPGKQTDDGKIVAIGLTQEQYEDLYQCIKEELHIILDKYELNRPKSAFHACDSVIGIYFHNWFVDMPMFPGVTSWQVASYELDLLEYYHEYEENSYIYKEGFSTEAWSKYQVYVP